MTKPVDLIAKVARLRADGWSYDQIALRLNITKNKARYLANYNNCLLSVRESAKEHFYRGKISVWDWYMNGWHKG